jgi:hypothetical protein
MNISSAAKETLLCLFDIQQNCQFAMTGYNKQGGGYRYYLVKDLLTPVLPFLKSHRCIIIHSILDTDNDMRYESVKGSDGVEKTRLHTYSVCNMTTRLQSVDNPEDYVEVVSYGVKVDQVSDKALGADTIARRYGLIKLFLPEGEFDPDSDNDDVRRFSVKAAPSVDSLFD